MARRDPPSTGRTEPLGGATPLALSHYDTLGVAPDATTTEIRRAYLAKVAKLDPAGANGASPEMNDALRRATAVVEDAWAVLGDERRRAEYDRELAQAPNTRRAHAEHVWVMERELEWPLSAVFGLAPPDRASPPQRHPALPEQADPAVSPANSPSGLVGHVSVPSRDGRLSPVMSSLEAVADWLAPHPRMSRTVTVPDVTGMRSNDAFDTVSLADLSISFVRLTEDTGGGHGVVVDQDPPAGATVPRRSTLTVHVVFPAEHRFGSLSAEG